ncbi:cytochrome d ubiquinol oxidase subunit II [Brevibacterium sp. BRM-1]|uniref:cytochrome d ubiquinol oxidase subunit II n=1 Tax=Brevibacterium sp. BRM-1 TaxID=2999062 RepID=UPI002282C5CA|nr:cytochrome d ubiquinol oxidase subunit II [Brevibacterium sp. BRM-1]WAL41060.1 cytochrome d ubiquinol oxidase subunit II [Brevibacterium sp. BRM-1]
MSDALPTIWFILIAVLWLGYLFLEGFDLGVGTLLKGFAKNEQERRLLINTIGPVWDGNEVWLLTAGGATFAAFPLWYASLFSALYLPLTLALVALILRAIAIEYRGKGHTDRWRAGWTWCMSAGSAVAAFCVGAMLALTTTGMPLNERGDNVGGPFAWVNAYAIIGGLGVLGFCILHGLLFLTLKTDGDVRHRAARIAGSWGPLLLLPLVAWAVIIVVRSGHWWGWVLLLIAAGAAAYSWIAIRGGREKAAFLAESGFLVAGVAAIFSSVYPVVMPSTLDPQFSLTVGGASSSAYTLTVMLIVAIVFVPLVILYQSWSYRVFAQRLSVEHIPAAHVIPKAVRSAAHS